MANRNYFNALAGLKLEDTPTNSPTAAAAASKRYVLLLQAAVTHVGCLPDSNCTPGSQQ
jgi:hypothetical protein